MHKGFFLVLMLLCYSLLVIKYFYRLSEGTKETDAVLQAVD